jgi:hypothetical protein
MGWGDQGCRSWLIVRKMPETGFFLLCTKDPFKGSASGTVLQQIICHIGQLYSPWRVVGLASGTFAVEQANDC